MRDYGELVRAHGHHEAMSSRVVGVTSILFIIFTSGKALPATYYLPFTNTKSFIYSHIFENTLLSIQKFLICISVRQLQSFSVSMQLLFALLC